jgi:FkbH-like protein
VRLEACSSEYLILKRRALRRELLANPDLSDIRIAVLGGSTTNEVVNFWDLLLLSDGFRPTFYQSEYNKYYEDAVLEPERLREFQPDIVYVHTSCLNIQSFPPVGATESDCEALVAVELARFQSIWRSLHDKLNCQVIQNNFELPPVRTTGNLDVVNCGGRSHFVNRLNCEFARQARATSKLLLHDVNALSATIGLDKWFDWHRWFSYKITTTPDASLKLARSLAALVRAIYGKSRKCLVLDLDNTIWGGVIGDDGPENLQIGRETPVAEAYAAFQEYCLSLRDRGILLAVCSKNDEEIAKQGLLHPDSLLKLEHFSAFKANWAPKHENLQAIAAELNLGIDSLVFVDDNPAERAIVEAQLPAVAVPDVGSDVSEFSRILQSGQYFESIAISREDIERADLYASNRQRDVLQAKFSNYGEYLDSLQMTAEIDAFRPEYFDRIAQLTNKTNQFNLTTRRYTSADIARVAGDPLHVTLYGRLRDTFGDNGLISVIVGHAEGPVLHLDLWLMSCRVLKRDMELAMLDMLVERARDKEIGFIRGHYLKTSRNGIVADHYASLGFTCDARDSGSNDSVWTLSVSEYEPRNRHIRVGELVRG